MPNVVAKTATTPADVLAALANVKGALERQQSAGAEALEAAHALVLVIESEDTPLPRLEVAAAQAAEFLVAYLAPGHGGSEYEVEYALRKADELYDLIRLASGEWTLSKAEGGCNGQPRA